MSTQQPTLTIYHTPSGVEVHQSRIPDDLFREIPQRLKQSSPKAHYDKDSRRWIAPMSPTYSQWLEWVLTLQERITVTQVPLENSHITPLAANPTSAQRKIDEIFSLLSDLRGEV